MRYKKLLVTFLLITILIVSACDVRKIGIEVSSANNGELYLGDTKIADLTTYNKKIITVENFGTYEVKLVLENGGVDIIPVEITSNGIVKISFNNPYPVGSIGPAGGYIFYDIGNHNSLWQYLEVAPTETIVETNWGLHKYDVTGTELGLGTGSQNTRLIVESAAQVGEIGIAAKECDNLEFGGFRDWFLPSADELSLIYDNLILNSVIDLGDKNFWTSSQDGELNAWVYNFSTGTQSPKHDKQKKAKVIAIRAF